MQPNGHFANGLPTAEVLGYAGEFSRPGSGDCSGVGSNGSGGTGHPGYQAWSPHQVPDTRSAARTDPRDLFAARKDAKEREVQEKVNVVKMFGIDTMAEKRAQEETNKAWGNFCEALRTDPASVSQLSKKGARRGMVNLAYLLVLVGCELDLYGFAMAFKGYWDMGKVFIKILLILCPSGYLLAALMLVAYSRQIQERITAAEENEREAAGASERGEPRLRYDDPMPSQHTAPIPTGPKKRKTARATVNLKYYHFLPVCRFFLVIKEKEVDDIEGIFRINSLSSFSLGIAQICGIIFQGVATNWELDIYTGINIGSQIINWAITIMYFMTPIAGKMGSAMKVETMIKKSEVQLRMKWEEWLDIVKNTDNYRDPKQVRARLDFHMMLDSEIFCLANISGMDLAIFTVEKKFEALKFLYYRANNVYADI